jgi:hypothetical protein
MIVNTSSYDRPPDRGTDLHVGRQVSKVFADGGQQRVTRPQRRLARVQVMSQ